MKSWYDFVNFFVPGTLPYAAWSTGGSRILDLQVGQNLESLLNQGQNYLKYSERAADFVPLPKVSKGSR